MSDLEERLRNLERRVNALESNTQAAPRTWLDLWPFTVGLLAIVGIFIAVMSVAVSRVIQQP